MAVTKTTVTEPLLCKRVTGRNTSYSLSTIPITAPKSRNTAGWAFFQIFVPAKTAAPTNSCFHFRTARDSAAMPFQTPRSRKLETKRLISTAAIRAVEAGLRPEKTALTTLDFVGDTYSLDYIIDTNFLHAGRNMGRISISTCYRSVFLDVVVEAGKDKEKRRNLRVQRLMRKKMLSLYLDFRMKRIEMSSWIERSQTVIGSYRRAGGNDVFAELFLVQMYYADGKKIKGKRMLQEIGHLPDFLTFVILQKFNK